MKIVYSLLGVLFMMVAAGIYALGPSVEFADPLSVERFVLIATPALALLGVALMIMAFIPPRQKKTAERSA